MNPVRDFIATSKGCRGLLLNDVLSLLGQMVGYVAVPWWITAHGGARDLSIYAVIIAVGTLACAPIVAPFCERRTKRSLIIGSTALLALSSAILAGLAFADHYDFGLLAATALLSVVATSVQQPASATIVADIVDLDQVPAVLGLQKAAQSLGRIGGPLVSGALIAVGGATTALAAVPMLLAMAALAALGIPDARPGLGESAKKEPWLSSLHAGLVAKWRVPLERGWTTVNFLVWIFLGPVVTFLIPLKIRSLGLSGAWLGGSEAALSLGMMLGALIGPNWLIRCIGRFNARTGAAMSEGLLLAAAGATSSPVLLLAAFACAGFANSTMVLVGQTHRLLAIPRPFRVRMTAVNQMSTQLAGGLGPMLVALALQHLSLPSVYLLFGLTASMLASAFFLIPRAREFMSLEHADVVEWYAREYPHAFDGARTSSVVQPMDSADRPALESTVTAAGSK